MSDGSAFNPYETPRTDDRSDGAALLTEEDEVWLPPKGLVTHADEPIPPDMDFFVPPPKEIGAVRSARSSLRHGKRRLPPAARAAILFGPGLAAMAILHATRAVPDVVQVGAFVALFLIGWLATRFVHTCSYVGKDGVARFKCKGSRWRLAPPEIFLFRDASELRTSQTRHYHNGVYAGTHYIFTWTDGQGRTVFRAKGTYHGEKKPPKPKDPFHFAQSAEVAWSVHLLDRAQAQLDESGAIYFRLGGNDWVAVGPGFIDLHLKGRTERCTAEEVGGVSISGGVFKVKRKDAQEGWFRSSGVFQFQYGSMANARLFLLALDRLLGLQFD